MLTDGCQHIACLLSLIEYRLPRGIRFVAFLWVFFVLVNEALFGRD
jgi:hypothetical protein